MAKILSVYENEVERTWYDSSNVFYSECDDTNNIEKNLRITFKDGRTYEYEVVNFYDYLSFRDAESQGKILNKLIKSCKTTKLDNKDVAVLKEELETKLNTNQETSLKDEYSVVIKENDFDVMQDNNVIKTISLNDTNVNILTEFCTIINIPIKQSYK